jgi:signal peptidase I
MSIETAPPQPTEPRDPTGAVDSTGTSEPAQVADQAPSERAPSRRARSTLIEIVETLVLTVVIFLVVQAFVAQPYKVQQRSMESTLFSGQYVLVDKLTPRWAPYSRGDIVVFDPPASWAAETGGVPLIKRVIGLPGDQLELRAGKVLVNGDALPEPYVNTDGGAAQSTDPYPDGPSQWLVPAGDLFVMGDNRENSADSRTFGPIEIGHVVGRAWLRYWPITTFRVFAAPAYDGVPEA